MKSVPLVKVMMDDKVVMEKLMNSSERNSLICAYAEHLLIKHILSSSLAKRYKSRLREFYKPCELSELSEEMSHVIKKKAKTKQIQAWIEELFVYFIVHIQTHIYNAHIQRPPRILQ